VSERGVERKEERTSLVLWIEVDVAVHDLVEEGLGTLRASVMTYSVDSCTGPPSENESATEQEQQKRYVLLNSDAEWLRNVFRAEM